MYEVCVIGAGPCGLAVSVALKKRNVDHIVLEKSCIASTIYRFPTQMIFNSTPQLLEIGDLPFYTNASKPTRQEALTYYRTVVQRLDLPVRQYMTVTQVTRAENKGCFGVTCTTASGLTREIEARRVVLATGYFDNPNRLGVEGEDLPHVHHYYSDAHLYYGQRVLVIGGTNSAAEAVIELYRVGADVRLVHRGEGLSPKIKPWVLPKINSLVNKDRIEYDFQSKVVRITPSVVEIQTPAGKKVTEVDHVLALTGFHPNIEFLQQLGVHVDAETGVPEHDEHTYETNVHGVYIAGVVVSGYDANRIFIETGRFHGDVIVESMLGQRVQ